MSEKEADLTPVEGIKEKSGNLRGTIEAGLEKPSLDHSLKTIHNSPISWLLSTR